MSEYWKSIPRKYCEFCKVWFQDNKSSVEFHERGLKHQGNVRRHLSEVRKKGAQKEREQNHMDAEMRKIEHAAMVAYEKDLILSGKAPIKRPVKTEEDDSKLDESNRFGEIRSLMADKAKEEALEKITKKMSKRIEWYESKTVEGKVYYYNRVTCDTKWTAPKCGFVSLEEQKTLAISDVPGDQSTASTSSSFKHEQFGKWQTIDQPPSSEATKIDLQLPEKSSIRLIKRPAPDETDREEQIEFGEKTVQIDVHKAKLPTTKLEFKKRKNGSQRNLRQRSDD